MRQRALEKNFSKIKKSENKEEIMKYFKVKEYSQGHVLTTTTSGSTDLFVISKGRVLIFIPNKYLKDYSRNFLILSILEKSSTFNENYILFDRDANFGSMVLEEETEILSIDKNNFLLVTDEDSLNNLRANYQAKERLFKTFIDKFTALKNEDVIKQQQDLCNHYKLSMPLLEELFEKSTNGGKILTTTAIKDKQKNIEKFNQTFSKPIDPSNCGNIPGTNRLAPAKMNGFTREQVLGMNTLKKFAGLNNASHGDKNIKGESDVNSVKNRLLDAEKSSLEEGFTKKKIGDKKGLNSINFEEEKKNNDKNHLVKFQQSNEDLLKKLSVINKDEVVLEKNQKKESEVSNIPKTFKRQPSNDKNVIEADNARINLLLLEHKK